MALRLQMSLQQQSQKTMPQNGSQTAHRVNPSPKIASAAEKIPSKVCSFPAKELQVLGKDGPFHRERTEPLGQTKVSGLSLRSFSLMCTTKHRAYCIAKIAPSQISVQSESLHGVQIGPQKVELNDMPDGASMRDCIFRAHDDRFFDIVGESPEIVRLAKKEHQFAHEVTISQSHAAPVSAMVSNVASCFARTALHALLKAQAPCHSLLFLPSSSMLSGVVYTKSFVIAHGRHCRVQCGCRSWANYSLCRIAWATRRQLTST